MRQLIIEGYTFKYVSISGSIYRDDQSAYKEIANCIQPNAPFQPDQLLSLFQSTSVPIFIILEDFDLFTQHTKQSLLYFLFSLCHSNEAKMVIIGESSRFNCVELLEKRVKSRFSQRIVNLNGFASLDIFRKVTLEWPFQQTTFLPFLLNSPSINQLLMHEWQTTRNPKKIYAFFSKHLLQSGDQRDFEQYISSAAFDYWKVLAGELSPLCAGLLVCIKKLSASTSSISFESVHNTFRAFLMANEGSSPSISVYARAFEKLIELGLISYCKKSSKSACKKVPIEFQSICLSISPSLIDEYFVSTKQLDISTSLRKWTTTEW